MHYIELHAASAFSFLEGASLPEDLIERALAAGLSSMALVDTNGVYGAPRFYKAAKDNSFRALVGAEVAFVDQAEGEQNRRPGMPLGRGPGVYTLKPGPRSEDYRGDGRPRLTLLAASRTGYRNLCRLLTEAAMAHPKGEACIT